MYVCSCFGVTEQQIREHAATGACTPRQIASASRAGTDCGSCVRRIQGLLGRSACPKPREVLERLDGAVPAPGAPALAPEAAGPPGTAGLPEAAGVSAAPVGTVPA